MKHIIILIAAFILCSGFNFPARAASHSKQESLDKTFSRLEKAIADAATFDREKTNRIALLRSRLIHATTPSEQYEIRRQIADEYGAFKCDSALHYVNLNIADASRRSDINALTASKLTKCDILARAGLFSEAINMLNSIPVSNLDLDTRRHYYWAAYSIYQFMHEYAGETEYAAPYARLAQLNRDSTLRLSRPGSFDHITMQAALLTEKGKYNLAIQKLDSAARHYHEGEREYSILRSTQSFAERMQNPDSDEALRLLAEAAISDVKGSIKENMAFRMLAELLYKRGDVRLANKFVKKSIEDASFFSARMRSNQSAQFLPIIDTQYDRLQHESRNRMRIIIYILIALALIFAITIFVIMRLASRLTRANRNLTQSKEDISRLNRKLLDERLITDDLNVKLSEANKIKEAYIMQFMEMSSQSLNSLEHFRKSMLLLQATGKTEELRRSLKSTAAIADALKELYETFDNAFLTIFPNFVEQFNALLRPEERFPIREGEPLNTELRIYSLIRMGVKDSHRIADFLRCSLSTIYTYRSKVKSRAIDPARFEDSLMQITSL